MQTKRIVNVGGLVITREDKRMVNKVLDSNRLSYGPITRKFEHKFAKLHDSKFAVFTNSGTSSLHISIAALKEKYNWDDKDEIIVPAVTFVATPNVVLYNNMKPVFVDVNRDTFNIDVSKIEEKITSRTRAILPVHLLGLPAEMDSIMRIAHKHNLRVLEDSAETMFARYKGKSVGSFGDIGCFSTYVAHYIVTGVGGLSTTSDPELAVILRSLANHGRDSIYINIDDDKTKDETKLREIISRRFNFVRFGHSFRATEMEAALGLSQLIRKDAIIKKRKEIAAKYLKGLEDLSEYLDFQCTPKGAENVYMLFGIVAKNQDKTELVNYLEDKGIETRDLLPLVNQPVYEPYFKSNGKYEFPIAHELERSGFYIGCHQHLSNQDVTYVIKVFHDYFKR